MRKYESYYIAGPMTGIPEFNFPAFDECWTYLKDVFGSTATVISPANMDRRDGFDEKGCTGHEPLTPAQKQGFARNDIEALLMVRHIVLLPGWRGSTGATNESKIAAWLGLTALEYYPHGDHGYRLTEINLDGSWSGPQDGAEDEPTMTMDEFSAQVQANMAAISDAMSGVSEFQRGQTPAETPTLNDRSAVLLGADAIVNGDRNIQYGEPTADFVRTAGMWSSYLGYVVEPHDVAALMSLLKLSRIRWSPDKFDSWQDLAGYAACGYQARPEAIAAVNEKREVAA